MYLIGIVGRCYYNRDKQNIIQTHDQIRRMVSKRMDCTCIIILPTEDIDYLSVTNGKDMVNRKKLDYVLDKCDAFIVPGGTYSFRFDEYIIKYAIKNDKPLLAICLGFQAMCSMFSKNRTRFDMTTTLNSNNHLGKASEYKHRVKILSDTKLNSILKSSEISTNSVHHDIVDFEMNKLTINAISQDGVIEGVEYPNKKFIMGLQWHPEYLMDKNSKKIFDEFVKYIPKD